VSGASTGRVCSPKTRSQVWMIIHDQSLRQLRLKVRVARNRVVQKRNRFRNSGHGFHSSIDGPATKELNPLQLRNLRIDDRRYDPTDQILKQGGRKTDVRSTSLRKLTRSFVSAQVD
jgi:hypothetical protein